jgi:hypothetical protein
VAERVAEVFKELSWVKQSDIRIHEGGVCSALITAEYPITRWADEVKFGVQVSCRNPCFSLTAREPLKFGSMFAFVVGHDGGGGSVESHLSLSTSMWGHVKALTQSSKALVGVDPEFAST